MEIRVKYQKTGKEITGLTGKLQNEIKIIHVGLNHNVKITFSSLGGDVVGVNSRRV